MNKPTTLWKELPYAYELTRKDKWDYIKLKHNCTQRKNREETTYNR